MEHILQKVNELQKVWKNVAERRKFWQDQTKTLIANKLEEIRGKLPISTYVQVIDEILNLENINLSLGFVPSGISIIKKDLQTGKFLSGSHYKKQNGYLSFSLNVDGFVVVIFTYPFIVDLTDFDEYEESFEIIKVISPIEIDETFIETMVYEFLERLVKKERNTSNTNPIGFKIDLKPN